MVLTHVSSQLTRVRRIDRVKALENIPEFMRKFPACEIPDLVRRLQNMRELSGIGEKPEKTEPVRIALATAVTQLATIVRA